VEGEKRRVKDQAPKVKEGNEDVLSGLQAVIQTRTGDSESWGGRKSYQKEKKKNCQKSRGMKNLGDWARKFCQVLP